MPPANGFEDLTEIKWSECEHSHEKRKERLRNGLSFSRDYDVSYHFTRILLMKGSHLCDDQKRLTFLLSQFVICMKRQINFYLHYLNILMIPNLLNSFKCSKSYKSLKNYRNE